jgi:hypothetical protein
MLLKSRKTRTEKCPNLEDSGSFDKSRYREVVMQKAKVSGQ